MLKKGQEMKREELVTLNKWQILYKYLFSEIDLLSIFETQLKIVT